MKGTSSNATQLHAESEALVAQVARLCAQVMADFCAVYRFGRTQPIAFASGRGSKSFEALRYAAYDDLYAERARDAGVRSLVCEPLDAGGESIGVLVLGCTRGSVAEPVAAMIAGIAATAVVQAERLRYHTRLSDRLQRSMLPSHLVTLDRVAFDAAYSSAGGEADVGGDWYDAFEIGDGKIGLSIGDVTGHGLEAAVSMGEIRHAIRSMAANRPNAADLLRSLDNAMSSQSVGIASAIVGVFDPASNILRYASAGHPPPLLVTALGNAYFLPAGGTLLGIGAGAASAEYTVTLSPGTACVLYTDGLTEYDRDVLTGEERLQSALRALAGKRPLRAESLHAYILEREPRDDCASLIFDRPERTVAPQERYVYSAKPSTARLARDAVRHFVESSGVGEPASFDILLGVGEAVANAIEHGLGEPSSTFAIDLQSDAEGFAISVESDGHWRSTDASELRGRGLTIMRASSHSMHVSSNQERTRVTLSFTRTP